MALILIHHGADINLKRNGDRATPLHCAAETGNQATATVLVGSGAKVNSRAMHGETPLLLAAANGKFNSLTGLRMARLLIRAGADPNLASDEGRTPLVEARAAGDEMLELYLKAQGARETGVPAELPPARTLAEAASRGNIDEVRRFLEAPEWVNLPNGSGYSPLALAAELGHLSVVQLLIAHGADVNADDPGLTTPLILAIQNGNTDVAKFLVAHGARIDVRGAYGRTPLHEAAKSGDMEIVKLLFDADINVNVPDLSGESPLFYAVDENWRRNGPELVNFLINKGADPNHRSQTGETPLIRAVRSPSREEIAAALVARGAYVRADNARHETALHWAVGLAEVKTIKLLLDHGARPDVPDESGKTPRDYADQLDSLDHRSEILKLLAGKGEATSRPTEHGPRE